jgi:DNA-directed RNA polymerase specialized sigma24 family protein
MISASFNSQSTVSAVGFPTTPWTVVLEASAKNDASAQEALARLIVVYYEAIVGYFRVKSGPAMAEDLAHDFQARLLKNPFLTGYHPQPSIRFRNYLATVLRRFWLDHIKIAQADKRGGGQVHESLDQLWDDPEADVPTDPSVADLVLDQQAALAFHGRAIDRLKAQYATHIQQHRLATLRPLLVFETDAETTGQLARSLGLSPGAFRQAIFRLRGDYYNAFRLEVTQTVRREDIDDEMRHLVVLLPKAISEPATAT